MTLIFEEETAEGKAYVGDAIWEKAEFWLYELPYGYASLRDFVIGLMDTVVRAEYANAGQILLKTQIYEEDNLLWGYVPTKKIVFDLYSTQKAGVQARIAPLVAIVIAIVALAAVVIAYYSYKTVDVKYQYRKEFGEPFPEQPGIIDQLVSNAVPIVLIGAAALIAYGYYAKRKG